MPACLATELRPLNILTFSSLFPSSARPQHGLFVAARLRELRQRHGFQAEVLAPVPWFPFTSARFADYARWARTPRREDWEGQAVAHPRYAMLPGAGLRMNLQARAMAFAAKRWLRRRQSQGQRFDLIDAHYFYPDGVAAAALSRASGLPLMITARGSDLNLIGRHAGARAAMLDACAQAGACVGVSAALVEVLRGWGVPEHKLHTMRNGVDLARFQPQSQAEARRQLGLDEGAQLLLCVGHLVELKGHALVIDALSQLRAAWPALRLAIIGDGPERAALQAQIERLGLQQQVRLVGALANTELAPWYGAADLMLLPSSREGLPNVLLEALACGTPVIATAVGGIPEVLNDARCGSLLSERSVPALAGAIEQALRLPADRPRIRAIAQQYGWASTSERLAQLMQGLAAVGAAR